MASNIRIAYAQNGVSNRVIGNDIAAIFSSEGSVVSVGAITWIGRVETVRRDAIAFQINVPQGSHADVEQRVDPRLHNNRAGEGSAQRAKNVTSGANDGGETGIGDIDGVIHRMGGIHVSGEAVHVTAGCPTVRGIGVDPVSDGLDFNVPIQKSKGILDTRFRNDHGIVPDLRAIDAPILVLHQHEIAGEGEANDDGDTKTYDQDTPSGRVPCVEFCFNTTPPVYELNYGLRFLRSGRSQY